MLWRRFLLGKLYSGAVLAMLAVTGAAQTKPAPPIPVWSGVGSVPQGYGNRVVFLTPDEHSVVVLWPKPDGTWPNVDSTGKQVRRRFSLQNAISPKLSVQIQASATDFQYIYKLENGKESKDSVNLFSVVGYLDQSMQTKSALWKGGSWASIMKERIGVPGAPSGNLFQWMGLDKEVLPPGGSTNFTLVTKARPGFTSASTEHFSHLDDLSEKWPDELPEEIVDQLIPVLDSKWIAHYFITLGPRYAADVPERQIALDYLAGIQELIRIHRLETNSPFIAEAIASLDAIASGSTGRIPIKQKPRSELEVEIFSGMQLALNIPFR